MRLRSDDGYLDIEYRHTVGHMRAIALSALVKNEGGFLAGENSNTFCSSSRSLVDDFTQFETHEIKELQIDLDTGCHLRLTREDLGAVTVRYRVTYGEFPRDHALIGLAFINGDMAIAQLSELRRILIG